MSEFVSYSGPGVNQDPESRRKIRSQAMRDFRRRQRDGNRIASLESGQRPRRTHQRSHAANEEASSSMTDVGNVSQPMAVSHSDARVASDHSAIDHAHTSRSNSSPSTTPEYLSSNADSLPGWDRDASGATFVDAAMNSLMSTISSQTTTIVPVNPREIKAKQRMTNVAIGTDRVVKYRALRPAPFQRSQVRHPGWACLQQIDGNCDCSNHNHNHHIFSDSETFGPAYHSIPAPGLLGNPLHSISLLPSSSAHDQEALQYFQRVVVKDISGIVAIGFWERLVPLMCQMEDAARQAAIALSQAHMEALERASFPQRAFSGLSSLQSEIKASQALRSYIEKPTAPSHELVLTCSIMLHTLESMLGRRTSALLHLENGLRMFKTWQQEKKYAASKVNEETHALSTAFARLDLSATIFDDDRVPSFEYDDEVTPSLPDLHLLPYMTFTNSRDVHHQLMRIGTPAWDFLIRNKKWRRVDAHLVPIDVIEEQQMHRNRYRAWSMSMDLYESRLLRYNPPATRSQRNDRRAELMSLLATRMHHWCAKRMLDESLPKENLGNVWDRNPHKLLRYAKAILEYTDEIKRESGHTGQSSFSPEIGICGILLCLAHRTALPNIRSEALGLAQSFDRKEGAQDLCGAFTSWAKLPHPRPPFIFMLDGPGH